MRRSNLLIVEVNGNALHGFTARVLFKDSAHDGCLPMVYRELHAANDRPSVRVALRFVFDGNIHVPETAPASVQAVQRELLDAAKRFLA
ncbi:MAG: hypothetical protein WA817_24375 [Candidatus Acidiferrum sp.]